MTHTGHKPNRNPAPQLAVGRETPPEVELGSILGQAGDRDGLDPSLRESFAKATQIGFEPPDHYRFEVPRADFHAAGKALRVEHFEQRREAVGVGRYAGWR
jgi:hypothetical protein